MEKSRWGYRNLTNLHVIDIKLALNVFYMFGALNLMFKLLLMSTCFIYKSIG